jgi:hypothetical protein
MLWKASVNLLVRWYVGGGSLLDMRLRILGTLLPLLSYKQLKPRDDWRRFAKDITITYSATTESHLDFVQIFHRTPAFPNQTLLGDIQVEHVQRVIDCFDLADLDKPHFDVLGSSD